MSTFGNRGYSNSNPDFLQGAMNNNTALLQLVAWIDNKPLCEPMLI